MSERPTRKQIFEELSKVDVSPFVEKKGQRDYLSWSSALTFLNAAFDGVNYRVIGPGSGLTQSGTGGAVGVGLEIEGHTHLEYLPVMNHDMTGKPFNQITSRDVSDTTKRAFVKAAAHFGLGLSLWVKDALPELPTATTYQESTAPVTEEEVQDVANKVLIITDKAELTTLYKSLRPKLATSCRPIFRARTEELS